MAYSQDEQPLPQNVRLSEEEGTLYIRWHDGHLSVYPFDYLRGACPCAVCKGHHRKLDRTQIVPRQGVILVAYDMEGKYALRFLFSDAHKTGIYTHSYLRSICKCDHCPAETF
ncbi:MAG: DUF971 domain-containing protein [Chloroflexi bacterium]|nr:DUF971 domain-containing protein [Chloroflexota bacterium]